jgi:hypothetical protein
MARINIEDSWWSDARRYQLAESLGGSLHLADGLAIEAWKMSQVFWGNGRKKIPIQAFMQIDGFQFLFDNDLAIKHGTFVYVRGTRQLHDWYASVKDGASKGGKSKRKEGKLNESKLEAKSKSLTPTLTPTLPLTLSLKKEEKQEQDKYGTNGSATQPAHLKNDPPEKPDKNDTPLNRSIWESYRLAYEKRYGEDPVRNGPVNSIIANIGKRLGAEAVEVIGFYVRHNGAFYVKLMHPVGMCLKDAESLRTQWATGRVMTGAEAKSTEGLDYHRQQMQRISEEK